LDFLAQKKNCGGVHFGTTASRQRGAPLALRAAWASPSEIPKNTAPHRMLNVKARSIIEASLPIVPHRVADRFSSPGIGMVRIAGGPSIARTAAPGEAA
jgi:hypothetical protein